ncbi:hypothetical protein Y032_0045g1159 [Ancylostoma ceylanicum]|nr:hypothetical protein Y032_0045g1159 [Ancylostoma ceylanicum]
MGAASTIVIGPGCYPKPLHFNDFKKAMVEWWNEAKSYSDNRFTDRTRPNFPQMANANATKVGCSFEKQGRLTSVLCLFNSRVTLTQEYYKVSSGLEQKNFSLKDTTVTNKDMYELCMYIP